MSNAAQSGRFRIGGEFEVNRLGFGAMRIVGKGIWGPPEDRAEAVRTLKRLPELGVDFIDTADSYGPNFSEELIREALHPYGTIRVATKGGLARTGPNVWIPLGRPEYLIQQAHTSRWRLGVETIDLWQLHRIDPKVPADEQFDAIKTLIDDGVIRTRGAVGGRRRRDRGGGEIFPGRDGAEPLQSRRPRKRGRARLLRRATGIGFIPWFPLNAGDLAREGSALDAIASGTRRARARSRSPGS